MRRHLLVIFALLAFLAPLALLTSACCCRSAPARPALPTTTLAKPPVSPAALAAHPAPAVPMAAPEGPAVPKPATPAARAVPTPATPAAAPVPTPAAPEVLKPATPAEPPPPAPTEPSVAPEVVEAPMAPIPGALPGDAVRAFKAVVHRPGGVAGAFESRALKGVVVYVITSTVCSFCRDYVARLKAIESTFIPRGVDVVYVYPNRGETDAAKVEWHAKQGFRGGQILDTGAAVARLLEAKKTPTVYVVNAKGVIVYCGGIDDCAAGDAIKTHHLANALDATLAGKPVAVSTYEEPG